MWHPVDARTGKAIFVFFFPKLTVNNSNFG